jgi:prevent-host-death family protein
MKSVNISTLRKDLSAILDSVREGSSVEIVDRKLPIARLVPVDVALESGKPGIPPWLARLARAGVVRLGTGKPVREILKRRAVGPPSGVLDALLDERRTGR